MRMANAARLASLAFFLAGGVLPAAQAAVDADQVAAAVDRSFRPLLRQYDVPGIAVAVTVDGQRFFFNYGVASRQDGTPVSQHTLFELGSVSKTFTATLAGYALAQKKISLRQHPGDWLPALRGHPIDRATLLQLGTYTAGGLPLQFPDEVNDDGVLAYFQHWKPAAAPGTQRQYSNPSMGLLGYVSALAMKRDFADAAEGTLLPKLALRDTCIRVPAAAMARYAWGYDRANRPIHVNPGVLDAEAYGVKSTSADMLRFVEANIDPSGLDPALRRGIEATHVGYYRSGALTQGLAWEQYPFPTPLDRLLAGNADEMALHPHAATPIEPPRKPAGPTLYDKTGSTNGFGAYVAFVPQRRIGLVMLANRNFPNAARVRAAHAVLEQLAAQPAQERSTSSGATREAGAGVRAAFISIARKP